MIIPMVKKVLGNKNVIALRCAINSNTFLKRVEYNITLDMF